MAIAFGAHLGTNYDTTALTSYSWTVTGVTSGRVAVLLATGTRGSSLTPIRPTVSGLGMTWSFVAEIIETSGTTRSYTGCFVGTGTPSGTTLTIDFTNTMSSGGSSLSDFSGVNTGSIVVQSNTGTTTGTGITVTLGSAVTSLGVWGGVHHDANEATTPGTSWTEIGDTSGASPSQGLESNYQLANDTSCDWTWTTSSLCRGIVIELNAAAAGGGITFPELERSLPRGVERGMHAYIN